MIISRTPMRVSFVGGGSDLPSHYRLYGGAVISCSIEKFVYITVNPRFDAGVRVSYSRTEDVPNSRDIEHPLVRAALLEVGIESGVEITSVADVPSKGSGLGSSSAFTVGLLHALYAYKGLYRARTDLGKEACHIEIDICGEPIGKQDQYATAVGGLNELRFNPDGGVSVETIITPHGFLDTLQSSLMMFYTGTTRSASAILQEQARAMERDAGKSALVRRMADMCGPFRKALQEGNLQAIGELLHMGWELKSAVANGISNPGIDKMYARGRKAGALGGKLLGAGGGGFMLFCVQPDRREELSSAMQEFREVPFAMNWTGSTIVFYTPTNHHRG
jgi:D-glycero-alpha-D-manno-heptose-7-phosphate kinase